MAWIRESSCFFVVSLLSVGLSADQSSTYGSIQQRFRRASTAGQDDLLSYLHQYQTVGSFVGSDLRGLLTALEQTVPWNQNVSQACASSVGLIIDGARNRDAWALQFVDAFGRPEAGLLEGNQLWLGSYHECMNAGATTDHSKSFRGKYCLASFGTPTNSSDGSDQGCTTALSVGMCFPDSCSDHDTIALVGEALTAIPSSSNVDFRACKITCQPLSHQYDAKAIAALYASEVWGTSFFRGIISQVPVSQFAERPERKPTKRHQLTTRKICGEKIWAKGCLFEFCRNSTYPCDFGIAWRQHCIVALFGVLVTVGTLYEIHILRSITEKDNSGGSMPAVATTSASFNPIGDINPDEERVQHGLSTEYKEQLFLANVKSENIVKEGHPAVDNLGAVSGILVCFSLFSNGKNLFATSRADESLTCVHGIRFLSMTWIVLFHTYVYVIWSPAVLPRPDVKKGFWTQTMANGTVSVDTFFAMSGLLLSYLFIIAYEKSHKFQVVQYYVHRYWRLTAVYAVIMVVYVGLYRYVNSGPLWPLFDGNEDSDMKLCPMKWWQNLLYVNNFDSNPKMCMGWTWYLANDMQFYWISPLILLPLVKKPFLGLSVMGLIFVAHIVATAVISAELKLYSNLLEYPDLGQRYLDYMDKYYTKPWTRIGPYLVGLFFGHLLAKYRGRKVRLPTMVALLLWTAAAVTATSVLYGLWGVEGGHLRSPPSNAIYNTLHSSAWAVAVCWVIFACVKGYGGFVNTLLSWRALIPLSRLTYCCYLIHIPVLQAYNLGVTSTSDFSYADMVYRFLATLVATFGLAFLFAMFCESPLLALEKAVEKSVRNTKKGRSV